MSRWTHVDGILQLDCSPYIRDKETDLVFLNTLTKLKHIKYLKKKNQIKVTLDSYPIAKFFVDKHIDEFDGGEFKIIADYFVNGSKCPSCWSSYLQDEDIEEQLKQKFAPEKENVSFDVTELTYSVFTLRADIRYQDEDTFCEEFDRFLKGLVKDDIWIGEGHFIVNDELAEHIIKIDIDALGMASYSIDNNVVKKVTYRKEY